MPIGRARPPRTGASVRQHVCPQGSPAESRLAWAEPCARGSDRGPLLLSPGRGAFDRPGPTEMRGGASAHPAGSRRPLGPTWPPKADRPDAPAASQTLLLAATARIGKARLGLPRWLRLGVAGVLDQIPPCAMLRGRAERLACRQLSIWVVMTGSKRQRSRNETFEAVAAGGPITASSRLSARARGHAQPVRSCTTGTHAAMQAGCAARVCLT
jgi:hypothetical protein